MKVQKATHKDISLGGYVGKVMTDYDELYELFGEPEGPSGDNKVQAEWIIKFNNIAARIYDYKNYGKDPEENILWHIGGPNGKNSYTLVMAAIKGRRAINLIFAHKFFDGLDSRFKL
jgi:hypothetical protein